MKISDITYDGIEVIVKYYNSESVGIIRKYSDYDYQFCSFDRRCSQGHDGCQDYWDTAAVRYKIKKGRIKPYTFVKLWELKRNSK